MAIRTLLIPSYLLLLIATASAIDYPVLVRLRGNFGTAPATVIVSARIERHADNRVALACIVGGGFETCSERPHEGEQAPLQVVFEPFREIPEGEYNAIVIVVRQDQKGRITHVSDRLNFRILPPFGG